MSFYNPKARIFTFIVSSYFIMARYKKKLKAYRMNLVFLKWCYHIAASFYQHMNRNQLKKTCKNIMFFK